MKRSLFFAAASNKETGEDLHGMPSGLQIAPTIRRRGICAPCIGAPTQGEREHMSTGGPGTTAIGFGGQRLFFPALFPALRVVRHRIIGIIGSG